MYDADGTRVWQEDGEGVRTMVGGLYERHARTDGSVDHTWTIQAPEAVAIKVRKSVRNANVLTKTLYPILDRLGSPVVTVDEAGAVVQSQLFDAWGKLEGAEGGEASRPKVNLGYTGHTAEDVYGIIDMGGRQYDPALGRFLQPDIVIQAPENMQSFNRYTYVFNNPFRYIDPSGYTGEPVEQTGSSAKSGVTREGGAVADSTFENAGECLNPSYNPSSARLVLNALQGSLNNARDGLIHKVAHSVSTEDSLGKQLGYAVLLLAAENFTGLLDGAESLLNFVEDPNFANFAAAALTVGLRKKLNLKGDKSSGGGGSHGVNVPGGNGAARGARSAAQAERLRLSLAADEVLNTARAGSGLKADPMHRAASFVSREQLEAGKLFNIRGGDGVQRHLLQTTGEVNSRGGIFEFIVDPSRGVTHQRFIPGGRITGAPNQRVP